MTGDLRRVQDNPSTRALPATEESRAIYNVLFISWEGGRKGGREEGREGVG